MTFGNARGELGRLLIFFQTFFFTLGVPKEHYVGIL